LAEPSTQSAGEILGASFINIDDDDFASSQSQNGVSYRGASSAGAELNHAIPADVGQLSLETLCEAPPISVVPDAATVLQNDGVNSAECSRVGRELIKQGYYHLLAGMSDVKAGKAEPFGRCQDIWKRARIKSERFKVDEFVDVTQTLPSTLPLVKTGRSGCLDASTYQPNKH
jgi:hypothetical protein